MIFYSKFQSRRRSSTQKELLRAPRLEKHESKLPVFSDIIEDDETSAQLITKDAVNPFDLKHELLQLEKTRKSKESPDGNLMAPPSLDVPTVTTSVPQDRPQSVTSSFSTSFIRGTFKSRSARNVLRPKAPLSSASMTTSTESRSQPTSPTLQRRSFEDKGKMSNGQLVLFLFMNSCNVSGEVISLQYIIVSQQHV